jgi:hypothetical protein
MRYLFLLNTPEGGLGANTVGPEADEMSQAWGEVMGKMGAAGVLIDCAPLALPETATTVRVRDGETLLTDGPAAEIKEWLGGYCLANCVDLDDALRWAALLPSAKDASVEVRAVLDTSGA